MCLPLVRRIAVTNDGSTLITVLTMSIKLCTTVTFFAVNLQAMETYPTCLRQTGISMGIVAANGIGMLGPYIVYVVSSSDCNCIR